MLEKSWRNMVVYNRFKDIDGAVRKWGKIQVKKSALGALVDNSKRNRRGSKQQESDDDTS